MSDRINDAGKGKDSEREAARRNIIESVEQARQQQEAELSADLRRFQQEHPPKPFDINDYAPQEQTDMARWVDRGIINVRVSDLPQPEGISGPADFQKESYEDMRVGLRKLELMKPYVADGSRASSDAWRTFDQQEGLSYENGYQKVYDAFYGDGAIRLEKVGDQYDIINGRHRIFAAKEMFMREIPARMIERH